MIIIVECPPTVHPTSRRSDLIQITPLPQHVPSRVCLSCDVCCRFPEVDSFLRPYFTAHEIAEAVSRGIDSAAFPDLHGSQIRVVPNPTGEGYLCSAFDPATSHCRIYERRPLDCQIYPLAVMWSADHRQIVLGWDTKCPFLEKGSRGEVRGSRVEQIGSGFEVRGSGVGDGENGFEGRGSELEGGMESIGEYGAKIAALIEQEDMIETFVRNPRLIGRYQDDVAVVRSLPQLTERLCNQEEPSNLEPRTSDPNPPSSPQPQTSNLKPRTLKLRPLTSEDYPRFQQVLTAVDTPLAAFALAPHLIWRHLFSYYWSECDDHLCLFADYADGLFMPLPPLGQRPLEKPLARAFAFMRERNHGSAVSRIENVPEEWKAAWEACDYRLTPKDPDYFYDARALVELRGDRYKSQRAACNRFVQACRFRYEPYEERYLEPCLDLYRTWAMQKEARTIDSVARMMLDDSAEAHRAALTAGPHLGLIGRVVWVDDVLAAYTFGYFRTSSIFCVLGEIADRTIAGLASYLFREFCREAYKQGATAINTLDDSGLKTLARSKQNYHPVRMIHSYVATTSPSESPADGIF